MRPVLVLLLLALASVCVAQKTQVKYYKSLPFEREVKPEKAKFSETTVEENGVTTVTVMDVKNNKLVYAHRGDEPIGVWSSGLNFDFQLVYAIDTCMSKDAVSIKSWMYNDVAIGYTAPVLEGDYLDVMAFIRRNLRYPATARRYGIQGTVHVAFTITEEGKIENIIVMKGVHVVLDKEAVRLFRSMKFAKPAMLNGKPVKVCARFPLTYKLG